MKIFLAPQECLNRRDGHVWPYLLTAALTLPLVRQAKMGGARAALCADRPLAAADLLFNFILIHLSFLWVL